jgi:hypothetical protein
MDDVKAGTGRWQVSPARRIAAGRDRRDVRCAECKTPAFRAYGDHVALRAWLIEYCKPLAAELRDYFRKNPELHARPDHWFGLLTAQLRGEVAVAWERSELELAHGIPLGYFAAREAAGESAVPDAVRAFVADGFVAPVCARCRSEAARSAPTPSLVRRRYVMWFFDGDAIAAQRLDPLRWVLLDEAIAYALGALRVASEG